MSCRSLAGRLLVAAWLLLGWLLAGGAHADVRPITLETPASDAPVNLLPAARLWHDASGERSINDFLLFINALPDAQPAGRRVAGFAGIEAQDMPLGRRNGALWVAVPLHNPGAPVLRHLVVSPPRLELLDAWLLTGPAAGTVQALGRSGLSVPLVQRPFSSDAAAWALNVPSGPATLVLRIQSRTVLQPQLSLWQPQALSREWRMIDLLQGLELGALALTILFTLVFALWLREFIWVWYGAACLAVLVYQACYNGHAVLWLWPAHPSWTLPAMALALVCAHVSVIVFFLRFIPRQHVSSAGRAGVIAIASLSVLGFLLVWLVDFQTGIPWLEVSGFLQPLVLPWLAWQAWRRGDGPSRFVLLGFGLLDLASLLRTAVIWGWIQSAPWIENWLIPLAAVLTSSVLMLAMADRILQLLKAQVLEGQQHEATLQERIQEATRELVLARDKAESAVQFKQRFLSRVSHDLRTPLHTLIGNAGLARRYLDQLPAQTPDDVHERLLESIQAVQRSGSDMLQLADELLELARSQQGRLELSIVPTHLPDVVQELASAARWQAQQQGNQLLVHTDLAVALVLLDGARVKQVLRNLLSNACAATQGGVITLGMCSSVARAGAGSAVIEVWVSDTGRGIEPAALARIFEPFEQLDASRATGSSGLGLFIAQQWVRLMGGELAVQSTPGAGSVFSWAMRVPVVAEQPLLVLPDSQVTPSQRFAETVMDEQPRLHGHVLVVDDVLEHRTLLSGELQNMGLQVLQAQGGLAAMALLQALPDSMPVSRVDLVLTDLNMPDGDGHALLQWCRTHRPGLAVVAISSSHQAQALFDGDLLKPASPAQLRHVLQQLLPPPLDWLGLRRLADSGDGLGVDAWIARHRDRLGDGPLARGVLALGGSLQLAALVRWLN